MSRDTIISLYKSKLKMCRLMGYQYGNWNNKFVCDLNKISERKLRHFIKKGELGNFIWNNVRMNYKLCININNFRKQKKLIDYGFKILRDINYLLHEYKKRFLVKLLN